MPVALIAADSGGLDCRVQAQRRVDLTPDYPVVVTTEQGLSHKQD